MRFKKLTNIDKKPYKSKYTPTNPEKYKGDVTNIICRSSWERKFANWCDRNENVAEWGSEELIIPYRSIDNRIHRYFPDFYMKYKQPDGTYKKIIVEIKPKYQVQRPVKKTRSSRVYRNAVLTYETNRRKWETANAWCVKHDMKFVILTEDHLKTF
jgi:hypothetical protein